MTIPWTRRDAAEVWQGETSTLDVSASLEGLSFGSLTTPVYVLWGERLCPECACTLRCFMPRRYAVLVRTSSWTEVTVTSTRVPILTLIGSTLGVVGVFTAVLVVLKRRCCNPSHGERALAKRVLRTCCCCCSSCRFDERFSSATRRRSSAASGKVVPAEIPLQDVAPSQLGGAAGAAAVSAGGDEAKAESVPLRQPR